MTDWKSPSVRKFGLIDWATTLSTRIWELVPSVMVRLQLLMPPCQPLVMRSDTM